MRKEEKIVVDNDSRKTIGRVKKVVPIKIKLRIIQRNHNQNREYFDLLFGAPRWVRFVTLLLYMYSRVT